MLRRILVCLAIAAGIGFALFWWLTAAPARLVLPPYAPDLANGLTTFNAGRMFLLSCRARPARPPEGSAAASRFRRRSGRSMRRIFRPIRPMGSGDDRSRIRRRVDQGDFANRRPLFSRLSLYLLSARQGRGSPRPLCLSEKACPVSGKVRDHDVPFPFNIRRNIGIWKLLFLDGKPFGPDGDALDGAIAAPI